MRPENPPFHQWGHPVNTRHGDVSRFAHAENSFQVLGVVHAVNRGWYMYKYTVIAVGWS